MRNKVFFGVMSGSSLDGVDVCVCEFSDTGYKIHAFESIDLPDEMRLKLKDSASLRAKELLSLDVAYGVWIGEALETLVDQFKPVGIGLHGHTVFHEPAKGYSLQIGSGNHVAAKVGVPVVTNFRQMDIAMGGQGAPLVSSVEKLLFPEYDYFLNLGGIGNFSDHKKGVAWDVSPFNQVANFFARKNGLPYDDGGALGAAGKVNEELLDRLRAWHYFQQELPKSMSNQQVSDYLTLFDGVECSTENALRTFYEQLLEVYSRELPKDGSVLVTGGGAFNSYFIRRLTEVGLVLDVPDKQLIEGKEALVFALLGKNRLEGLENVNGSYTGSNKWTIAGDISGYVKR